jgi:hypothetical protein
MKLPSATPPTDAKATEHPLLTLRLTMYVTAGPGMSSSTIEAAAKASTVSTVGTAPNGSDSGLRARGGFP